MIRHWLAIGILITGLLGVVAFHAQAATSFVLDQAAACTVTPSDKTTAADIQSFVSLCLTVSDTVKTALNTATQAAFQQNRLSPENMLDILKKLENSQAAQSQKEQICTIFTNTLNDKIPVTLLIDNIAEGILLHAPFDVIVSNVQALAATLEEVKKLLDSKGITTQKYSQALTDTSITEISNALEDYIANSNNPNSDARNAQAVDDFVIGRLKNLIGTTLTQQVVNDIQSNVSGAELSGIALNACVRRGKCST
jgi:hypothetical protein